MLRVPAAVGRDLSDGAGAVDATDGDSMMTRQKFVCAMRSDAFEVFMQMYGQHKTRHLRRKRPCQYHRLGLCNWCREKFGDP